MVNLSQLSKQHSEHVPTVKPSGSPVLFAAVSWGGMRSGVSPRAVLLLLLRLAALTMATGSA